MGSIYAFLTTMLWSGNYVVARLAVGKIPPITLGALRWLVAPGASVLFRAAAAQARMARREKKFLIPILVAGLTAGHPVQPVVLSGRGQHIGPQPVAHFRHTPIFTSSSPPCSVKGSPRTPGSGPHRLAGYIYLVADGQVSGSSACSSRRGHPHAGGGHSASPVTDMVLRKVPDGSSRKSSILTLMVFFGLILAHPFLGWNGPSGRAYRVRRIVIFSVIYNGVGNSLIAWWLWNLSLESRAHPSGHDLLQACRF